MIGLGYDEKYVKLAAKNGQHFENEYERNQTAYVRQLLGECWQTLTLRILDRLGRYYLLDG